MQNLAVALAALGKIRLILLVDEGSEAALHAAAPQLELHRVLGGRGVFAADHQVVAACRHLKPDIYHRPTGQLPFARLPCRSVASIADLNFRSVPMSWTKRVYKELSYRWTLRRADRITCVSTYTRDELVRHLHAAPEYLSVIHHGTSELPPADFALARSIGGRYWLTFGHQAHKNVETCIRALAARTTAGEKLVVVGQSQHIDQILRPEVRRLGLDHAVVFAGRVSDATLRGLYEQALGLLFLSRYEGFGLPLLEAMGCDCPVIASNVCSLPEVAGDAALLFAPNDDAGVSAAMTVLAENPARREDLIAHGRIRSQQFTWKQAAEKTLAVYQSLLSVSPLS